MSRKVEWKSVLEDSGVQSVMTAGTQLMLQLFVDSLGLQLKVRLCHIKKKNLRVKIAGYDNAECEWSMQK